MIGKVTFSDGSSLVLNDDLELESDTPGMREAFEPRWRWHIEQEYSPALGAFGAVFLQQVASRFGGKAELAESRTKDEGVVY